MHLCVRLIDSEITSISKGFNDLNSIKSKSISLCAAFIVSIAVKHSFTPCRYVRIVTALDDWIDASEARLRYTHLSRRSHTPIFRVPVI